MENIIISNKKDFESKKNRMKKDGAVHLHILSDFDRTLTYAAHNGKRTPSLISYLRNGNYLAKNYAERATALFNKYHPIEISAEISPAEKNKAMYEWWNSHYRLLAECGLDEGTMLKAVKDILKEDAIKLREGCANLFRLLFQHKVPLVIMSSAGIGNMVTEFLKEQNLLYDNVHFVGNTLKFKDKKFAGIDDKIIHVFNKSEIELKSLPIYDNLASRKNVILLGDSLGDLDMAKGINSETLIKIGFLDENADENLKLYTKNFDVVILENGSMQAVNDLVREILE